MSFESPMNADVVQGNWITEIAVPQINTEECMLGQV